VNCGYMERKVHMAKKAKKEDRGTSNVSVRLPDELISKLDTRANEEHRSRGNLIRMLLEEAMTQNEGKKR
jgi:metal-responsive CopG/Arc/MetJ family transcriptional regulator